jgi:PTH1 family peptidyl-tRNA hydrolase
LAAQTIRLVVGLGNPGEKYARTRHNAGFWLVDELARRHGGVFRTESRHQGELARIRMGADELWLLKPASFMNRSGGPVQSVAAFYRIAPGEMLVAHDELDLPCGTLRLKQDGGHGGHNGLRDIIAALGAGFWRLRIGIGHPGGRGEVVDYVLQRPAAAEERLLEDAIADAADALPELLAQGAQKAMNRLHTRAVPALPPPGGSAETKGRD